MVQEVHETSTSTEPLNSCKRINGRENIHTWTLFRLQIRRGRTTTPSGELQVNRFPTGRLLLQEQDVASSSSQTFA